MERIKLHYLVGDVHQGGHDVRRVAANNRILLEESGAFDITVVCDEPCKDYGGRKLPDIGFDEYLSSGMINECEVIVFNCGNWRFNDPEEQKILTDAVAAGRGFVFLHGDHPCYWKEVGMKPFPEIEKMAMMMWREPTSHGDYTDHHVTITDREHPITRGLPDFDTRDELFCGLSNVHGVPCRALATAYSDAGLLSRHGRPGTGRDEPVALVGSYGRGRTYNQVLGHVWPFYTGHGLGENTMLSLSPRPLRMMFVRGCEWAARGDVALTKDYRGEGVMV